VWGSGGGWRAEEGIEGEALRFGASGVECRVSRKILSGFGVRVADSGFREIRFRGQGISGSGFRGTLHPESGFGIGA